MKTVAITGGIGSGKTIVCRILNILGYPVYDCDKRAKYLTATSHQIKTKLNALLGEDIYSEGELDKKKLSSFLFASTDNAKAVNSIIHPSVKADFESWQSIQKGEYAFIESAILFESGFDALVDEVWSVRTPIELRIKRVMERNGLTEEDVKARINSQMSDEEREKRSAHIIDNGGEISVIKQVMKIVG